MPSKQMISGEVTAGLVFAPGPGFSLCQIIATNSREPNASVEIARLFDLQLFWRDLCPAMPRLAAASCLLQARRRQVKSFSAIETPVWLHTHDPHEQVS